MNSNATDGWFDPEATTFGDRVTGAREQAQMTQAELAKRLGVKETTLENWENDHLDPRANKLSMMAGMLNVTLPWLMTGQGDGPADFQEDNGLSHEAKGLLREVREINQQLTLAADRLVRLEARLTLVLDDGEID